jgi:hypothetical protein
MNVQFGMWFAILTLLLSACTTAPLPPLPNPVFAALNIRSVAVGPIASATYQPSEQCSLYIDEDLRSALVRELRRRGYEAFAVGNSLPRSFSDGSPPPLPGVPPPTGQVSSPGGDGLLVVWIDEFWENSLCSNWEGPKYLTMGAEAVLYAGSPPVEVWRSRARNAEQGPYTARDLIWLTTARLTDQLLGSLPAGSGWSGQR